jgi:predicted acyl esterase
MPSCSFFRCPSPWLLATVIALILGGGGWGWGCSDGSSNGPGHDGGLDGEVGDGSPPDGAEGDGHTEDCAAQVTEEVDIPMSDGKHLSAFVRRPETSGCEVPTILIQTPYDKTAARELWFDGDSEKNPLFASTDYAFVVVDWRGFYGSADAQVAQPDYGQDGYDTVEWIATQPWSDGQVATWGVSALCRIQYWTAVEQPEHLVCGVPIFCSINNTYEEYYPGGVLRREYNDTISALFGSNVVEDHPYEDMAWSYLGNLYDPADVEVPMLVVAGWYDLDATASIQTFRDMRAATPAQVRDAHRLMVGPWHHFATGGESSGGRQLTQQELTYYDSEKQIQKDSLAWFDHCLSGEQNEAASWSTVRFVMDGPDRETWLSAPSWPPPETSERTFYLTSSGELTDASPTADTSTFPYDPTDPSPTVGGATLSPALLHGPHDQAEVIDRGDALVFMSAPLGSPLSIRGEVSVELDVATTGADTDFAVRLTDVAPSPSHLLIGEGIQRLKLRDSLSTPSEVIPGERYSVTVRVINELGYTIQAGHRLGLILTSSNHPRFARNPNTGDDFFDQAASPTAVTNTVYLDGSCRLILPVE